MPRFLRWEGTEAKVVVSYWLTVRVKLFGTEAKEKCGYKLSDKSSLKSMYTRLIILGEELL